MFISKRVLIIVGAVAVVVVGLTVFAFVFFLSQSNQSATASRASTPSVSTTATKTTLRACALGTVELINTSSSSFVVAKGTKMVTIMVDSTTVFRSHGKKATLNDLAVGDEVRVVAQGTCDKTAQSFSAQAVAIVTSVTAPAPTPAISPTP